MCACACVCDIRVQRTPRDRHSGMVVGGGGGAKEKYEYTERVRAWGPGAAMVTGARRARGTRIKERAGKTQYLFFKRNVRCPGQKNVICTALAASLAFWQTVLRTPDNISSTDVIIITPVRARTCGRPEENAYFQEILLATTVTENFPHVFITTHTYTRNAIHIPRRLLSSSLAPRVSAWRTRANVSYRVISVDIRASFVPVRPTKSF
jgi:hypothetical protein